MAQTTSPATRRFHCTSCGGEIEIPFELPPTTAPCPHCGTSISSPPPPEVFTDSLATTPVASPPGVEELEGSPPPQVETVAIGSVPGTEEESEMVAKSDESGGRRGLHPLIVFMGALVIVAGALVALVLLNQKDVRYGPLVVDKQVPTKSAASSLLEQEDFLESGWKELAQEALSGFLQAGTPENKARYVIGGDHLVDEMARFYGGVDRIDESDTPVESFSYQQLDIMDRRRGIFLMRFERPSQVKMSEFFRPVAPLEVQHELEDPDLLLSAYGGKERFAMDPVRVMAFFKETEGRLLLDWHVYTQTKYRLFRHFITTPRPGASGVFRVMVREALPVGPLEKSLEEVRTFRLSDPSFGDDRITVSVANDALAGRVLSELAWINIPDRKDQNRYATVRLSWKEAPESHIQLDEVVCWEFLGLGGEKGNAKPASNQEASTVATGSEKAPGVEDENPHHVSIREERAGTGSGEGARAGNGIEDPAPGVDEGEGLPNPPVNP